MKVENRMVAAVLLRALAQVLEVQQNRGLYYFKQRRRQTDSFFEELGRREQSALGHLYTCGAILDPNRPFRLVGLLIAFAKSYRRKHGYFLATFVSVSALEHFIDNYTPLEKGYDFRYKF